VSNKTVAFVLYPGLTPPDLIGPLQVMSGLEAVEEALGSPDRHHVVVVAERLDAFATDTPVRIAASTTIHDMPAPDVILVPWWWRPDASPTGESGTPRLFAGGRPQRRSRGLRLHRLSSRI
jgi:hypothetical protein